MGSYLQKEGSAESESPCSKAVRPSVLAFLILVICGTALPFLPALRYGFVYDDDVQVLDTVAMRSWQSPGAYLISSVWVPGIYRYYRPLFFLWLRVNAALFGLHAAWWHLAGILAHLAATALVFFILRRHFRNPWTSTLGALIFGVHPTHVESVVWISGVTDPLAAIGALGSFLLWLRKREPATIRLQAGVLALYAAALLCKETPIVLPAIIFVYALTRQAGKTMAAEKITGRLRIAIYETLPFGGMTLLYIGARLLAFHSFRQEPAWTSHRDVFFTAPSVFLFYVRHLLWPVGLSLFYDFRLVARATDPRFWLPLMVLGASAVGLWFWSRRRPYKVVPAAVSWMVLPILPVMNIALFQRDDFVHDRYLYFPVLGLAILGCALLESLIGPTGAASKRPLGVACGVLLLAGMAGLTAVQSAPWQSNLALYTHAAEHGSNTMARNNLASEYAARGRLEEAREILQSLTRERPDFWLANYNLGYVNYRLKQLDAAERFLRKAVALNPDDADGHSYLGLTLFRKGLSEEAAAELREAITRKPDGQGYHFALGTILQQQGNLESAKAEFREELRYHPGNGLTQMVLAGMEKTAPEHAPIVGQQR